MMGIMTNQARRILCLFTLFSLRFTFIIHNLYFNPALPALHSALNVLSLRLEGRWGVNGSFLRP